MSRAFRIVADENMPNVEAWFSSSAKSIDRKAGRSLSRDQLTNTDVLLVRSVTQVNEQLLLQTPVQFVGSATIGTDHIDQTYLSQHNIQFAHAPGCNAQSVCDWLLSVLARLYVDHGLQWQDKVVGVVGVGRVGSTVVKRLRALGCRVLVCDPIKQAQGECAEHLDLDALLPLCDIVCLHAPHTKEGAFPTDKMVNADRLANMRSGAWLINAGRGPVVEGEALLAELKAERLQAVLDVWPNEPSITHELLDLVALGSPHVAGYSLEGKYKGTQMIAEAYAQWAGVNLPNHVPTPPAPTLDVSAFEQEDSQLWLSELLLAVYDPARDTITLRMSATEQGIGSDTFDALRKQYPTRREIASIVLKNIPDPLIEPLKALGFNVH